MKRIALVLGLLLVACGDVSENVATEHSPIVINGTTYTQDPVSGYYNLPSFSMYTTGAPPCLLNCWTVPAGLFHFTLHSPRRRAWWAVNYWENGDAAIGVTEPNGTAYNCSYNSPNPNAVPPGSPGPDYADWRSNAQIRWQCTLPTGAVWQFDCPQASQFGNVIKCNVHRHWASPNYSTVDEAFNVPVTVNTLVPVTAVSP